MAYSKFDDEMLVRLITRAQADALHELYDRYSRLVYSLALSMVGDEATAEEITLDVFVKVWEKAETYRAEQAKVSTWLIRITRHHAIDILRRQGSRPKSHSLSWAEEATPTELRSGSPEELIEESMRREQVRTALAQLPVDQKQALALAYLQGYTHRQIAEKLNQPLGTIKTRIRLGMEKLRQILQEIQNVV
jgi:RNA polymerase sigma-70 factor (ECF subfamily)